MTENVPAPTAIGKSIYAYDELVSGTFLRMASTENLTHALRETWETDTVAAPPSPVMSYTEPGDLRYIVRVDEGLGYYGISSSGNVFCTAVAKSDEAAKAVVDYLQEQLPKRPERDDRVSVRFWSLGEHGPESIVRTIDAPTFDQIRLNYGASVGDTITRMQSTDTFTPGKGGQLLLWHGAPGTGKTWALRSLALSWKQWCDIEYIVDPEAFFGKANYLMRTLLGDFDASSDRWRLLIFEDTGEMLSNDARERAGQGLSRLLNTVDGFIGQGLRVLALITTNEDLGKLHDAVSRPGRCAVQLGFDNLSAAECQAWASEHGVEVPRGSHSLAELYAIRDGFEVKSGPHRIGFGSAA